MARQVHRAAIFHLRGDPGHDRGAAHYVDDGALVVENGHVIELAPWSDRFAGEQVTHHRNALIVPGFVDCHVHYPQIDMIASPGGQLLDWLKDYTFPSEARFADPKVAAEAAPFFLEQLLRNGTTTALVFATVHKHSAEALFEAALARNMRIAAGKVLMDRNCPEDLRDTAETGHADSADLIRRYHGKGRLTYAITPRFAASSTERQLALAAQLLAENPGVLLQTHLSENGAEIDLVRATYPDCVDYLEVYEKFGLATDRSVFAHGIHLSSEEWRRMGVRGSAVAFCPTSNLFLGSGLFNLAAADREHVRVGLATDVGAGTSLSQLASMNGAYKVAQLQKQTLDAFRLFYLATLGGARALGMDDRIGNFAPGKEADFVVLDLAATPLLARRVAHAKSAADRLFALAMLGDDRAVAHTYVMGERAYSRR